jgi:hypothetical protein
MLVLLIAGLKILSAQLSHTTGAIFKLTGFNFSVQMTSHEDVARSLHYLFQDTTIPFVSAGIVDAISQRES